MRVAARSSMGVGLRTKDNVGSFEKQKFQQVGQNKRRGEIVWGSVLCCTISPTPK
jgi:hypothetical protein